MDTRTELSPTQLLLDPNNYRFLDYEGFRSVGEDRYHEDSIQQRTMDLLDRKEDLDTLIDSITANGYVPVESIVVAKYQHAADRYVVVEGNRRCGAVKKMLDGHYRDGITVPQHVLDSVQTLPVLVAPEDEKERKILISTLMGIRHVSGVKEWGPYQQALLILQLRETEKLSAKEAAQRVGLKTREATRRYRALRALLQMKDDDLFSEYAKPGLYGVLQEAVESLAQWLDWNDRELRFENNSNLSMFYGWITTGWQEDKRDAEDEAPKLKHYRDVRDLARVVQNDDALAKLMEPEGTLSQALAEVDAAKGPNWQPKVKAAVKVLGDMSSRQLKSLEPDELELLQALKGVVDERLEDRVRLMSHASVE